MPDDQLRHLQAPGTLSLRADAATRQVDLRLFTWDEPGETSDGPELIERGAVDDVDPRSLVLRMDHLDPPIGRGIALESRDDGPYATFQASQTARADEALQLAADGTYTGASVGFVPHKPDAYRTIAGRRVAVRKKLDIREVSLTWRPVHRGSAIIAIRSEGTDDMTDQATDQAGAQGAQAPTIEGILTAFENRIGATLQKLEERARKDVDVPGAPATTAPAGVTGRWTRAALSYLAGERPTDMELRALADVIVTGNEGAVPKQIRSELLGVIDPARPFLESTREVDAGEAGMTMTFPRITQRPIVGVQATQKSELASRATTIDTVDFAAKTIGGAGDLSMQLLRRSSPSFLELWLQLLAEAYAVEADNQAVDALLAAGVQAGTGAFDPESPSFAEAFTNSQEVGRLLAPDRIWLSTAAMAAFIDAKVAAGGAGQPMYPGMFSIAGVTRDDGNNGPLPVRLRPVHVPALDDEAVDIIIGPSRGFAWAEDGTYTLQADVPAKFGRDVGLAGILWFMPVYPAAFTTYALPV